MRTRIAHVFCCAGSFHCSYPTWELKAEGKEFLLNLRKFRDQMLQGQGTKPPYSTPKMQQWSLNLRGPLDRKGFLSRDNIPVADYQLGSAWMIDAGQRNYPYILDCYYTSRPHNTTGNSRDVPPGHFHDAEEGSRDFWTPPHLPRTEAMYEENWGHHFLDRSRSHLGTSTSASLFPQSVLQHNDSNNTAHPGKSQWWARSRPHGIDPQTSFLEPPNFGHNAGTDHPQTRSFLEPPNFSHNTPNNYYDNFSDRSLEEEEQQFGWGSSHRLSRTYNMDDLEGGEFNLPFDDIYGRPPESPSTNHDPTSFGG